MHDHLGPAQAASSLGGSSAAASAGTIAASYTVFAVIPSAAEESPHFVLNHGAKRHENVASKIADTASTPPKLHLQKDPPP